MIRSLLWLIALLAVSAGCSRPAPKVEGPLVRTTPWTPDFVQQFGELPLMKEGRVMPLSTLAAFTLYAVHGRRDVQFVTAGNEAGKPIKLSPTEWLLDVFCYPEQASRYPLFRIENVSVLGAIGIAHDAQKQGFEYVSYAQMWPVAEKLQGLARDYERKPEKDRSEVEAQVLRLFQQFMLYHGLSDHLAALHAPIGVEGEPMQTLFPGRDRITLGDALANADALRAEAKRIESSIQDTTKHGNFPTVLSFLLRAAEPDRGPSFFPPPASAPAETPWLQLSEVVDRALRGGGEPTHATMVGHLQTALMAGEHGAIESNLRALWQSSRTATTARDDASTVGLESYYYRANWHFHAMFTFVLGCLLAVVCWLLPRNRLLWWASVVSSIAACVMLAADIGIRCAITGHPPVTRLYDTFLFIGFIAAATLLIAEWVLPRRVLLALAPLSGALLILFARLFEQADGQDTMKPLVAVLLSNFWLIVHVPTMNIGYASGIAAAAIAGAWVFVRVLRIDHPQSTLAKALVRGAYGVTCFSLATSVVGTILGGVWANDSWGRFWGWDPKENGALLICLSQIALLHARMSGIVRDAGFILWTIATGMIVVFSWFHTNLLGVGLHAYGFSRDLLTGVWVSYMGLGGLIVVGAIDVLLRPSPAMPTKLTAAGTVGA
jgi:ABC-type transport system involved in cytochrome c biogenesis permease subunit